MADWFKRCGPIDAVVTCAGISAVESSLTLPVDDWMRVIDVNLTGTFLAAREAIKNGATRVVTVGSIHGCTPTSYPQRAAYTASKGGVKALTEALAVEFAADGVGVFCVAPGHLPVLMDGTGAGAALLDAAEKRTPTGGLSFPDEVARIIWWLVNDAPLAMTGNTIVVDGGFTLNTYPL
jgi:glucose 1-dehydrogenase